MYFFPKPLKMKRNITFFFFSFTLLLSAQSPSIPFDSNKNQTATYHETIDFYQKLAAQYPKQLQVSEHGTTDSGYPLHLAVLSADGDFSPSSLQTKGKNILFINNAIHAGEPCGVDATMLLYRDLLSNKKKQLFLENTVLVAIPFYNIGGGLNRGSYSRANQFGPEAYGFRGNAKNLDLNRDFIKCDSRNAQTFNQIFVQWQPDVFVDNHTSNGADYQYAITLIATQKDKLNPVLSEYMQTEMLPKLYAGMAKSGYEMTPYVFARDIPDNGIAGFLDLPRYGSGYAALHHAISFISETHMLKPYEDRVMSTYHFMHNLLEHIHQNGQRIKSTRAKAIAHTKTQKEFDLNWTMDFTQKDSFLFKGYEAKYKPSEISGLDRLYYDRTAPFEKYIPFFNTYKSTTSVQKPQAYIIPQAYQQVIQRLEWNGVQMQQLEKDIEIEVELYRISDYKTRENAYEGHYLHSEVQVQPNVQKWQYRKGDYVILTNQAANRYLVETLEPQAPDSWFAWNFFDGILMQKEYFSSYVFEDTAVKLLAENPDLKKALEIKKAADEEFAKNSRAQLDFIYKRSLYYEKTHNVYPVGRVISEKVLKTLRF